jgi:hypothetical protein
MDRTQQLAALQVSLSELVETLRLDPRCQWRSHFEQCLDRATEARLKGASQRELNDLSAFVMSVYRGAGSFNDYAPVTQSSSHSAATIIPGMESLDSLIHRVYDDALQLRVIGHVL